MNDKCLSEKSKIQNIAIFVPNSDSGEIIF